MRRGQGPGQWVALAPAASAAIMARPAPERRSMPASPSAPLAALAAALLSASGLAAGELRIAAGYPDTPWHAFAAALAEQYKSAVPGARVGLLRGGNGYWNPIVVNARRAEFGIVNTASAVWAYTGDETAYGKKKYRDIRAVIAGLRPVWIAPMLREDYIRGTGLSTLQRALRAPRAAPRIVMQPAADVVPIVVDMILAAMGSSRQTLRERGGDVLQLGTAQIPALIRGGRADLYFAAAGPGGAQAFRAGASGQVRFVDLPPDALAALRRAGLAPLSLPPRSDDGGRPVSTVDLGTMFIVHRDVPSEQVYRMLEALVGGRDALARSHPAWQDYAPSPYRALRTRGVPLHPGAVRFFRERGWPEMARRGPIPLPRSKPKR